MSADRRPGLDPRRLAGLMRDAVHRLDLDLSGRVVVTEAATGAYAVTPVLAVLAGAREVRAVAAAGRYGTADEVAADVRRVAAYADAGDRLRLVSGKGDAGLGEADVVTNSGHLRPLDAETVAAMKPGAAIPLMYEAWELRPGDVDLDACRRRGVRVAGTNECHPAVDVFSYLGVMAVKLLTDAGIAVYRSRIVLACDNPFSSYIARGLAAAGAEVATYTRLGAEALKRRCDAVVVATRPADGSALDAAAASALARSSPGAVVAHYWGDLDRAALAAAAVPVWPARPPADGHMAILPSAVGPEPIVRLQAAGLKVGEVLTQRAGAGRPADLDYVQAV